MEDKTVLITGATSGIGRGAALELASRGARLVLPVRNMDKGRALAEDIRKLTGNGMPELFQCDLESLVSVRAFAQDFLNRFDRLDVLINNAGTWPMHRTESADGIEKTFAVNHLAPFLLTNLLLEPLQAAPQGRIINVASSAHRAGKIHFSDPELRKGWNHFRAYAQSKLANILFTRHLAKNLEGTSVTANSLHPGVVTTQLFKGFPGWMMRLARPVMLDPGKGSETTVFLAADPGAGAYSGQYFARQRPRTPARQARNDETARRLWELSREYTGN